MADTRQTRRGFILGTASLAVTAGLAGCQAGATASLEPELPSARLDETGWRHVADVDDEVSEEVHVAGTTQRVRVQAKADVYENDGPVRRLAERFGADPAEAAIPAESFVAAKARVDPPVTRLLTVSDAILENAVDAAEAQAKRQLRENGFSNVRRVEEGTLDIEAGGTATHRVYRADYPYESFEVAYQGLPVTVVEGTFTIEAQLAVWPYRGLLAAGSGIYPGESGELTVEADGREREVSLDLRPAHYREDVRGLIRLVS